MFLNLKRIVVYWAFGVKDFPKRNSIVRHFRGRGTVNSRLYDFQTKLFIPIFPSASWTVWDISFLGLILFFPLIFLFPPPPEIFTSNSLLRCFYLSDVLVLEVAQSILESSESFWAANKMMCLQFSEKSM